MSTDFKYDCLNGFGSDLDTQFMLPDGNMIDVPKYYRINACEMLFTPDIIGRSTQSVDEAVFESIKKCDMDTRADLMKNLIFAGGNTLFEDFAERMVKELKTKLPQGVEISCSADKTRINTAWRGGSMLADHSVFKELCVSKGEYEEHGEDVFRRKGDCNFLTKTL